MFILRSFNFEECYLDSIVAWGVDVSLVGSYFNNTTSHQSVNPEITEKFIISTLSLLLHLCLQVMYVPWKTHKWFSLATVSRIFVIFFTPFMFWKHHNILIFSYYKCRSIIKGVPTHVQGIFIINYLTGRIRVTWTSLILPSSTLCFLRGFLTGCSRILLVTQILHDSSFPDSPG